MAEDTATGALDEIASLGALLADKAQEQKEKEKAKDAILGKIGALDPETAKSLLKDERIQRLFELISDERAQAASDPPGTIKPGWIGNTQVSGFTKKDWTEADLRERRDGAGRLVTFTPTETIPVFWNGLRRQLIADEEVTIEKCFYDVYQEHRRASKSAREHAEYLFRKRDHLQDPSMVSPEGARARGLAEIGWYVPGGGSIIAAEAPAQAPAGAAEEVEVLPPGEQNAAG